MSFQSEGGEKEEEKAAYSLQEHWATEGQV